MVELTRRFFLGGAIALVAVQTFVPRAMSNMPTITGDGVTDDSEGLGALFRNDPVIFKREQIGIDSHKGVIFYGGRFAVKTSIHVPKGSKISIGSRKFPFMFTGLELPPDQPFFICDDQSLWVFQGNASFELKLGAPNRLVDFSGQIDRKFNFYDGDGKYEMA